MQGLLRSLLSGAVVSGTPLLYATLAELLSQRAGIVNLGLEGVMLVGAVSGFIATVHTGSAAFGVLAAAIAGGLFNLVFAFLVVTRRANQLATGLALMFAGVGLSALMGTRYVGSQISGLPDVFGYDVLVWAAAPLAVLMWWTLGSTRWGLAVRAVGENPVAAFVAGKNPRVLQYQVLFLAGALGGIAGAHLSLGVARTWSEWMTAGRGFVAVALVIFARWHPVRAIGGALLFGGAISLQLLLQARGVPISPFVLDMLPYVLSLAVLLLARKAQRNAAPASLGRVFQGTP